MYLKYHKKKVLYRLLLENFWSIKHILLPQKNKKKHNKKIHSMYKKDYIIMFRCTIFRATVFLSDVFFIKKGLFFICLQNLIAYKSKTKIMPNNLIFGEFIVVCCFIFFGLYFFLFWVLAHIFT